jgi:uncharacterized glyoxalase superfamily protein PhnB
MTGLTEQAASESNRSMPSSVIIPVLSYPDVREAVDWLCQAFGFVERLRIMVNGSTRSETPAVTYGPFHRQSKMLIPKDGVASYMSRFEHETRDD